MLAMSEQISSGVNSGHVPLRKELLPRNVLQGLSGEPAVYSVPAVLHASTGLSPRLPTSVATAGRTTSCWMSEKSFSDNWNVCSCPNDDAC